MNLRPTTRVVTGVAAVVAASLALLPAARASIGDLDTSFSGDGKATVDFGGDDPFGEGGTDVAIQSDGKIVAVGGSTADNWFGGNTTLRDFVVVRYNTNGTLDLTLDGDSGTGNGIVETDFGEDDHAAGVAIQSDGKIVVVGAAEYDFVLARYNTNGTLDTSFSDDGKVSTGFFGEGRAVAVQSDGKIVVVGASYSGGNDFALARYNTDGTLDAGFGTAGKTTTDVGGVDQAAGVVLQPDGKLLVAGKGGPGDDFALARYATNGTLDASFGTGGRVTTNFGGFEEVGGLALAGTKIVVVGGGGPGAGDGYADFAVARYTSAGALDPTFSGDGMQMTGFYGDPQDDDWAHSVEVQPDGKIVVVGGNGAAEFALVRYTTGGVLDPTFSGDGKQVTDFGGGTAAQAYGSALQSDGKILAVGRASDGTNADLAIARYVGIDTTSPVVARVTSSKANGTYTTGAVIPIRVVFNEPVTVTGAPRIALETGATNAFAGYASGSGTTTLTFSYTVVAGHGSADLDYTGATALMLNGGSIKDEAGNNAVLTLPAPGSANSLGGTKNLVIDTTFRPDGWIRLGSGADAGDGVYNTTGSNQTRSTTARRGETKTFWITAQNDDNLADRLTITGPGGGTDWVVRYDRAGTNITGQVTGSGYRTPSLAPGSRVAIKVTVKPNLGARIGTTKAVLVKLISVGNPTYKDAVKANVTVRTG